jgi:perosamine synthetase
MSRSTAESSNRPKLKQLATHPIPGFHAFGSRTPHVPCVLDGNNAVFTRSARSALALALRDAGITDGARVLIPNYYCPTMISPVEYQGAKPQFYPITRDRQPDLNWLIEQDLRDCKALVAVHYFGLPFSMSAVRNFCDTHRLLLIEDCAHAFFGSTNGVPVGQTGDYAIASLPKFFPVLEGGVLASKKPLGHLPLPTLGAKSELKAIWNTLEIAADYGSSAVLSLPVKLAVKIISLVRPNHARTAVLEPNAEHTVPAEQVRQEALKDPLVVPAQIRRTDKWIFERSALLPIARQRRINYRRLAYLLHGQRHVEVLFPELSEEAVPYVFPIRVPNVDHVYHALRALHLPVLRWDRHWPGAIESTDDVGRQWSREVIKILCHQDLSETDMAMIAKHIIECVAIAQNKSRDKRASKCDGDSTK